MFLNKIRVPDVWYENGKQNARSLQGMARMIWGRGETLVKAEMLPGKHVIIAVTKSSALCTAIL